MLAKSTPGIEFGNILWATFLKQLLNKAFLTYLFASFWVNQDRQTDCLQNVDEIDTCLSQVSPTFYEHFLPSAENHQHKP